MLPVSMRSLRLFLAVACLGLLAAAPASAQVRYASPSGGFSPPCNPTACDLPTAVMVATAGDEVQMAPGTYLLPFGLTIDKAIEVGGVPEAQPLVEFGIAAEGVAVDHPDAFLHDVRFRFAGPAMAYTLTLKTGTVEGVYADGTNVAGGCTMSRGLIRDSVCREGLDVFPNGAGSYQAAVTNVTANPVIVGAQGGANLAASITNTLMLPQPGGGGAEDGLLINVGMGSSAAVLLTNSSYDAVDTTPSAGTEFQFTPAGTNGNQTVAPLLVDAAAGDFHQLPGSPTIDGGTTTADPLGTLDLAGAERLQPRCIGGTPAPDIGAYEFTPTAACPSSGSSSGSSPTPAKVPPVIGFGKLERNLDKGTAKLEVEVPGAGQLQLGGKGVVARQVKSSAKGTVKLAIKAKGKKAKKLLDNGSVKLRAAVTFTAADGSGSVTKIRPLKLKLSL